MLNVTESGIEIPGTSSFDVLAEHFKYVLQSESVLQWNSPTSQGDYCVQALSPFIFASTFSFTGISSFENRHIG